MPDKDQPLSKNRDDAKKRKIALTYENYPSVRVRGTLCGVFKPNEKKVLKSDSKTKLHQSAIFPAKSSSIAVEGDLPLYSMDEEVLIALLAMVSSKARRHEYSIEHSKSQLPRDCLGERCLREKSKDIRHVAAIEVYKVGIIKLLGWSVNSASYAALMTSLVRLSRARIRERDTDFESNIIGFPVLPWSNLEFAPNVMPSVKLRRTTKIPLELNQSEIAPIQDHDKLSNSKPRMRSKFEVLICTHLSEVIIETNTVKHYGVHFLDERALLSDLAKTFYSHLVAQVREGQARRILLNGFLQKAYGTMPSVGQRSSAVRALKSISSRLSAWTLEVKGSGEKAAITVSREKRFSSGATNKKSSSANKKSVEILSPSAQHRVTFSGSLLGVMWQNSSQTI